MLDFLVVGAGLSGAVSARVLAERGYKVQVIDKRPTIGGNVYDYFDDNGICVQQYGPHIFHTNDKGVFDFLSRFTKWYKYEHRVLGNINGTLVPVPFNLTSIDLLFEKEQAQKIKDILLKEVGYGKKVPILQLKQHSDKLVRQFAEFVYQNIFYIYTMKQWGFKPEELGEAVMNRVPVYVSEEDRYFTDEYQFMPEGGFTPMVEKMLEHENITVQTGVDALELIKIEKDQITYNGKPFEGGVIYTGRLDELYGNCFGELPYRSLRFDFQTLDMPSFQPAAVVNYNTSEDFTRISEFSKFACPPQEKTVIVREYSKLCQANDVPYYPIPKPECQAEYDKYLEQAKKVKNLYLLGRLANYKYINMDIAVKNAIDLANTL